MNILFLMGSSHIEKNDEHYPFYLTELNEKLILEQSIEYCMDMHPDNIIFCIKESDIKQYRIDSIIKQLVPNAQIVPIISQTRGAICTALLASKYINNTDELIIMAVDDFISEKGLKIVNFFREKSADAGVVSFNSIHPRYSFAKTNANGDVIQVEEKLPISKNALVSFYWFKHSSDFINCAMDVIRKDSPINNSFYIAQTLNEMILSQKSIALYKISNNDFHPLKNEQHLAQYLLELQEQKGFNI